MSCCALALAESHGHHEEGAAMTLKRILCESRPLASGVEAGGEGLNPS